MENEFLRELTIRFGLNEDHINKLLMLKDQLELSEADFMRVAEEVCEEGLVELSMEELVEKVRREDE